VYCFCSARSLRSARGRFPREPASAAAVLRAQTPREYARRRCTRASWSACSAALVSCSAVAISPGVEPRQVRRLWQSAGPAPSEVLKTLLQVSRARVHSICESSSRSGASTCGQTEALRSSHGRRIRSSKASKRLARQSAEEPESSTLQVVMPQRRLEVIRGH